MGFAALAFLALLGSFADRLYDQGDYSLAALEYARILYESSDTLGHPRETLRLARCRHLLGDAETSLSLYSALVQGLPDSDHRAMALLGAGAVYADLGLFSLSAQAYSDAAATASDSGLVFRGMLLEALSPLHSFRWSESSAELSVLAGSWEDDRGALAGELSALVEGGGDLPYRSPFWCGAASAVVPGSGQLLCGHTADGLIAFGMTAATGALLYLSIEEGNTSTSVLLGWLSLSFYGANVYGGGRAAEYYNAYHRRQLLEEVYGRLEDRIGDGSVL
ncbi:MAG: hypothetical protein AVO35_05840 [Candidatus Aegiribacteria sp. MLS_C]|nr:MAG: hypothetical protein AVO35_05840 [Candidatus Aegiribacteria sp. MLS_C]